MRSMRALFTLSNTSSPDADDRASTLKPFLSIIIHGTKVHLYKVPLDCSQVHYDPLHIPTLKPYPPDHPEVLKILSGAGGVPVSELPQYKGKPGRCGQGEGGTLRPMSEVCDFIHTT